MRRYLIAWLIAKFEEDIISLSDSMHKFLCISFFYYVLKCILLSKMTDGCKSILTIGIIAGIG